MKKNLFTIAVFALCLSLTACSGKKSAASVAKEWCELNAKVHNAEGEAKDAAKVARDKFEKEMEAKYKDDKDFMKEIGKEVEKCEDASEGR
jgi:maltose-binding protein MalE